EEIGDIPVRKDDLPSERNPAFPGRECEPELAFGECGKLAKRVGARREDGCAVTRGRKKVHVDSSRSARGRAQPPERLTIHLFFFFFSDARPSKIRAPGRMCSSPRRIVMDPGGPPATRGPMRSEER